MKQLLIIICITILYSSCKKDKTSSVNCDLPKSIMSSPGNGNTYNIVYEYNTNGSIKSLTEKYPTIEYKWDRSYENGGQRIIVNTVLSATAKDTFELNSDGYIIYWVHQFSNGPGYYYYTYDGNGFLASLTYEYFNTGNPVSIGKYQETYTNTIVNGNLTKRIKVSKNIKSGTTSPPETDTWEYDESKPASPFFNYINYTNLEFIGKGIGNNNKNLPVKSNRNGVLYNYTYVLDAKGRLKEVNGIYVGSSSSYKNQKYIYTYACD